MSLMTYPRPKGAVVYPDSDGEPIADNTLQFAWITKIKGNLEIVFKDDPNVFVAGDLLWYPVEGDNKLRTAPDAMVVVGRPKGDRGSYMQWLEDNIPPQVVFEILSPSNRSGKMVEKSLFYERHGVEEYYIYDPDTGALDGFQRVNGRFEQIPQMHGWVSPRLKCRFELHDNELQLFRHDGSLFVSEVDLANQLEAERARANAERARADAECQRAERLAQRLRELGVPNSEL
jgi:Uma2 family endonuclease